MNFTKEIIDLSGLNDNQIKSKLSELSIALTPEEAKARGYSQGGQVQGQGLAFKRNALKLKNLKARIEGAMKSPMPPIGFMDPATHGVITKKDLEALKAKYDRGMKLQQRLSKSLTQPKAAPKAAEPKAGEMLWGSNTPAPSTDKSLSATVAREDAAVTAALSQSPASMMAAFQSSQPAQPAGEVVPAQITKPAVEPQAIKPAVVPQPVKQQAQEVVAAKGEQKQSQRNAAASVAAQTERQNAQASKQVEAMATPPPDKPIRVPVPKPKGGGRGMSSDDVYNYRPGFGLFSGGF